MSSLHSLTKKFDPLGHAVVESITGIDKQQNALEQQQAKDKADIAARTQSDAAAADLLQVRQVATRSQQNQMAAAAAGATRSGNEQDSLVGVTGQPKKRYASRVLLGE